MKFETKLAKVLTPLVEKVLKASYDVYLSSLPQSDSPVEPMDYLDWCSKVREAVPLSLAIKK